MRASASAQRCGRNRRANPQVEERQQQHQRQIAEIALAEDDVLEGAEIAQTGAAVVKDLLAAFESAVDIAGQKILQDGAADAVVEQAVVAAVERPHAADEARIVDRDHQQRQSEQYERHDGAPHLDAHQHQDQRQHRRECNGGSGVLP